LIVWQVDHYLDLNSEQKASLGRSLAPMLARHRTEALPVYEAFLRESSARVRRGLTRQDLDWAFGRHDSLRADLVEQLIGNGAVLLTSVNNQQIEHLERALQKDSEKTERLLKLSKEDRLAKRAADTLEFVEEWMGPLSADQKSRITAMSLALPDLRGFWYESQRQSQQELLQALREHATQDVLAARLRDWFLFQGRHAPATYQQSFETMRSGAKDMILAVDRMSTPQQRAQVLSKLQELINTVHDLQVS